jgi:hypothetical protein
MNHSEIGDGGRADRLSRQVVDGFQACGTTFWRRSPHNSDLMKYIW